MSDWECAGPISVVSGDEAGLAAASGGGGGDSRYAPLQNCFDWLLLFLSYSGNPGVNGVSYRGGYRTAAEQRADVACLEEKLAAMSNGEVRMAALESRLEGVERVLQGTHLTFRSIPSCRNPPPPLRAPPQPTGQSKGPSLCTDCIPVVHDLYVGLR